MKLIQSLKLEKSRGSILSKKKHKIYVNKFVGFFLLTSLFASSLYVFLYSVNLKLNSKNETNLYETVALTSNVEPEFDSQGIFWWLLEGENLLKLTNYSNEKRKVRIFLKFQNNPCKNLTFIKIDGTKIDFDSSEIEFDKDVNLKPYATQEIKVENFSENECKVTNDQRIFGAKFRKWYVR